MCGIRTLITQCAGNARSKVWSGHVHACWLRIHDSEIRMHVRALRDHACAGIREERNV